MLDYDEFLKTGFCGTMPRSKAVSNSAIESAIPGRSFSSGLIAPFHLPFRKASWQNVYLAFPF
jgi:hypothetical protein